jgi:hypothetical protein
MKRGGIALAVVLAISGVLRIAGPAASPNRLATASQTISTPAHASAKASQNAYQQDLYSTIQDFYGYWPDSSAVVPDCARDEIEFVVAILPDPVHTRLGLFFDRSIEALQQAAQKQHYAFDRAILPWDRSPHPEPSDPQARRTAAADQEARESFPGLLIFRDGYDPSDEPKLEKGAPPPKTGDCYLHHKPLFVFIVGETPTGGIRKKQFRNTLQVLRDLRGPQSLGSGATLQSAAQPSKHPSQPLRILGPSFSGSLDSLATLLHQDVDHHDKDPLAPIFVYSGTVTGRSAMEHFKTAIAPIQGHFASFIENDDYTLAQFIRFAGTQGFVPDEIAVLSEDETEYGSPHEAAKTEAEDSGVIHLHFPREVSYFRSAYQKEIEAAQKSSSSTQSSGPPTLPLDLNASGNDDDSVPPYNIVQTTLSQESAMLGVVSELQKHEIKFTILLASDPSDELFLATYLRTAYPQGRVVVTSPDLLLCREEDTLLHGVLGLNTYPLLPGLDDRLGQYHDPSGPHEDRLFVSSLSVGEFNAMVGLLAMVLPKPATLGEDTDAAVRESLRSELLLVNGRLPAAPYAEYAPPATRYAAPGDAGKEVPHKPLLWLTILGRDGYWPIVALSREDLTSADGREPVVSLPATKDIPSTLHQTVAHPISRAEDPASTPPAWNMAFCLCLVVLVLHAILSWKGSVFADSESRAQFARDNKDLRGAVIIGIGVFALASAFALLLLTRSLQVHWRGGLPLVVFFWLLYVVFVAVTFRDLGTWRAQPRIALGFLIAIGIMTIFQVELAVAPPIWARVYWSNRLIHLDSGLSPVLPVLILLAGGYWWMWMSLRAIALVDLRRPRLPAQMDLGKPAPDDPLRPPLPDSQDLDAMSHRISDEEAEQLRTTAHPFYVKWQVIIPVIGLFLIALTVLDLKHPIQTIEGRGYDWGFTALLCVLVGTFLGSLLKLVFAWLKCRQILAGLDRLPLREAFGRMKDLSWHSFWNPGGSTLRETYKIMSRCLQNLERLRPLLEAKCATIPSDACAYVRSQVDLVFTRRDAAMVKYHELFEAKSRAVSAGKTKKGGPKGLRPIVKWLKGFFAAEENRASKEQSLMTTVENLQRQIAKAAAAVIRYTLVPFWAEEPLPVVSEDKDLISREKFLPVRSLAEEFAALVYVNFLVSVLLRMRTFVMCTIGLYVCIVVAISVYPFEPHPALQAMAVILLIVMGAAIGYVYAEMHREPILSKLTSTNAGELGWDFWLKLASAGVIPIFSLLAAQFPDINKLLFNWLAPALNAVK